ncbi:MAG: hypothetical protein IMZ67_03865 [Acidobacteria bacterium]|nr:hypothetical protein [Acidobacteriota bacterium]
MTRRRQVLVFTAGVAALTVAVAAGAPAGVTFSKPGLITSIGQSSDIAIVKVMLNTQLKLGLNYKPTAQVADLAGVKSLLLVVGASAKGLGAAGLDMDKEIERTRALLKAAKAAGVPILVLHTGGESRRGKTSNDLIDIVVPEADYVVVVAAGNKDKLFNTLAAKRNVPVVEVEKVSAAGEAVRAVFKD